MLTTDEFEKEKVLRARIEVGRDESDKAIVEETDYEVNDVPLDWPYDSDWKRGDEKYDFRPTFPKFDKKADRPPKQLGLNTLIAELLALK